MAVSATDRRKIPVKYPYKGNVRWAFMKWADIESAIYPGEVYLRRLRILQTPWFAFYLHFIYEPDLDRDPHDHPCNFWALIVRGGYIERVFDAVRQGDYRSQILTQKRGSIHKMPIEYAHQIISLRPDTITLCFFGRRQRRWGFWTSNGFVDYETYQRSAVDEFA